MDDTQEKIRRNVVTLSAAIVAIFFIDPAIKDQVSLLGIAHLEKINPTKLWVCVTVALFYLGLRYRFGDQTLQQLSLMREEYLRFRRKRMELKLTAEMRDFLRFGAKPKLIADPQSYANELIEAAAVPPNSKIKSIKIIADRLYGEWPFSRGDVGFTVDIEWGDGRTFVRDKGRDCRYQIPIHSRIGINVFAFLRLAIYSKSGVDVLAPIVLVCIAMALCVWKLIALNHPLLDATFDSIKALTA